MDRSGMQGRVTRALGPPRLNAKAQRRELVAIAAESPWFMAALRVVVRRNPVRVSVDTYRQRVEDKRYAERWPRVLVVQ